MDMKNVKTRPGILCLVFLLGEIEVQLCHNQDFFSKMTCVVSRIKKDMSDSALWAPFIKALFLKIVVF
ncbi:hypothetical protein ACN6MY_04510 [Peribacillus sp. B-H-3]|uniref:hypothetical protein n=1 Tax=Peribacillus sp. B-H-3 TaxID=3400420 RepID=UPI003B023B8E